jgi:hypothetical protein
VRAALFMGALVAAAPLPRAFRQRLVEAGKSKLVAVITVARNRIDSKPWRDVAKDQARAKP